MSDLLEQMRQSIKNTELFLNTEIQKDLEEYGLDLPISIQLVDGFRKPNGKIIVTFHKVDDPIHITIPYGDFTLMGTNDKFKILSDISHSFEVASKIIQSRATDDD